MSEDVASTRWRTGRDACHASPDQQTLLSIFGDMRLVHVFGALAEEGVWG
ncbi:MAG: hypothetical protein U0075_14605 [Thermomicrobiales bacterium]